MLLCLDLHEVSGFPFYCLTGFDSLLTLRGAYDPAGLFIPPLFSRMERRETAPLYPGCALAGDCFCQ